jgi:hypothetical protein
MEQGWAEAQEKDYPESSTDALKQMDEKTYIYLVLACEGKRCNVVTSEYNRNNA